MQGLIPSQWQSMLYGASKPILGQAQQTAFMGQTNQGYNQASQNLMSQLAKRGALNSGSAGSALAGLAQGKMGTQAGYLAQAPVTNATNSQTQMQNLLGMGMNYKPVYGSSQSTTGQSTSLTDIANYINSLFNTNTSGTSSQTGTTKQNASGLLGLF